METTDNRKRGRVNELEPPWVLFCDKGKPLAILPAGRSGEVASIKGLTMKAAQAIVGAANIGRTPDDALTRLEEITKMVGGEIAKHHLGKALALLERTRVGFNGPSARHDWTIDMDALVAAVKSVQP